MPGLAIRRRGEVLRPIIGIDGLRMFFLGAIFDSVYIAGIKDQFGRKMQRNLTDKPSSGLRDTNDSSERVHGVEYIDMIM